MALPNIKQEVDATSLSSEPINPKPLVQTPADPSKPTTSNVKKPPSKKRKVESSEDRLTPSADKKPSAPAPSKANGTKIKKTASFPLRKSSTQVSDDDNDRNNDDDDNDDEQVYCICRKKDDHSWMIGCDGGCDDWFHGKCVDMSQRDEDLIDKFICPTCSAAQGIKTTWKPMCRLEGCRRPARLRKGEESKYCSDACGLSFMINTMNRASLGAGSKITPKKQKTETFSPSLQSDDIGPLGGRIRNQELKALTSSTVNADDFRNLGAELPTPPQSSPEESSDAFQPSYTEQEITRIAEIENQKQTLKEKRELIKARGQLVSMMRSQREKLAEKMKVKEICAFDRRWTMDDGSFKAWRETDEGRAAFENGSLEGLDDAEPNTENSDNNVCLRKRCERHRQWPKLVLQDVRFEEADVGNEMRRIDAEEKEIVQGAKQRAKGLEKGVDSNQSWEGWVEKVPDPEVLDIKMEDIG